MAHLPKGFKAKAGKTFLVRYKENQYFEKFQGNDFVAVDRKEAWKARIFPTVAAAEKVYDRLVDLGYNSGDLDIVEN